MEFSKNVYVKAYIIAAFFSLLGAFLKISHAPNANVVLAIGIIATLIFIIIGIIEVNNSKKISSQERILWTIGFLFPAFLTGLLYLAKRDSIV